MRARMLVVPAALLVALTGGPSHAAKAPLITDPAGDHPVPPGDILSADIVTIPKGTGTLQITMTLSGAPATTTPYSYSVNFTAGDCQFSAVLYNHPLDAAFSTSGVGCHVAGSTSLPEGNVKVKDKTITWTVPLTGALKRGVLCTDINAASEPSGVVSGLPAVLGDAAATDSTYKIGS